MTASEREVLWAGQEIARFLQARMALDDQGYWDQNYGLIREMGALEAILEERRHFFVKTRSREDGITLIVIMDLCWQVIRNLAGITGKDREWADAYLPAPEDEDVFPDLFELDRRMIDDQNWVFQIHSVLRHPGGLWKHAWILGDRWPSEQAERVIRAAASAASIFEGVSEPFTLSGRAHDVERKLRTLGNAAASWDQGGHG